MKWCNSSRAILEMFTYLCQKILKKWNFGNWWKKGNNVIKNSGLLSVLRNLIRFHLDKCFFLFIVEISSAGIGYLTLFVITFNVWHSLKLMTLSVFSFLSLVTLEIGKYFSTYPNALSVHCSHLQQCKDWYCIEKCNWF